MADTQPSKPVKVFTVYENGFGKLGTDTAHNYRGGGNSPTKTWTVSATTVRQAFYFIHQSEKVKPDDRYPLGVLAVYTDREQSTLWCGCHDTDYLGGMHGKGIRTIRDIISSHEREH